MRPSCVSHWICKCIRSARCAIIPLFVAFAMVGIFYFLATETNLRHITNFSDAMARPFKHAVSTEIGELYDEQAHIAKVSILYGDSKPVYERALRTHKLHNRIHGYPFFIQRESILDGYWTKPAHLQAVILRELENSKNRRLECIFWVDADTVVLNYQTPLEAFLPPKGDDILSEVKILVTNDWNGLNNGVFAIRVGKFAVELFADILAFRDFLPNAKLDFQDQSAMEAVLQKRKFAKHKVIVPQRWFNAYKSNEGGELEAYQVRPGDFLVHFAGVGGRETHMTDWCELSERRDPAWNKLISATNYSTEIKEFWKDVKEKSRTIGQRWKVVQSQLRSVIQNATTIGEASNGKVSGPAMQALSAACKEGQSILELHSDLEDNQLTEEDIKVVESEITKIEDARVSIAEP